MLLPVIQHQANSSSSGRMSTLSTHITPASFVFVFIWQWLWRQRLVWQSTVSAKASFHSSPMHNPGVCEVSVCVGVAWLPSWWWCMCESFMCCIFIVLSPAVSSTRCRTLHPTPDRHQAAQAHPPSQQGLVLQWPHVVCTAWHLTVNWQPTLITAQVLLFLSVMACHSLKLTQADPLYLSENLIS